MLKIKDSVDLKELEKFGIYKEKENKRLTKLLLSKDGNDYYITIKQNRKIDLRHYSSEYRKLNDMSVFSNIIYDLIKADLVVKVEE